MTAVVMINTKTRHGILIHGLSFLSLAASTLPSRSMSNRNSNNIVYALYYDFCCEKSPIGNCLRQLG